MEGEFKTLALVMDRWGNVYFMDEEGNILKTTPSLKAGYKLRKII